MKRKNTGSIVYSTNPDFTYENKQDHEAFTPPVHLQQLMIRIESKGRKGKTVTVVEGFIGKDEDLVKLARELKARCGTGGSAKDKQIIIQGDFMGKILDFLSERGYKAKKAGG